MIYVFFASGFEEIEGLTVVDVLRRAELPVKMVGVGSKQVVGAHDISVNCDIRAEEVDLDSLTMVVLPGGMPGTTNLEKNPTVQAALEHAVANNLWIGAICAAPSILGHKNLLDGKNATVFPGFEKDMGKANMIDASVVADGNFITGNGPAAALEFSLTLVEKLLDKETAQSIGEDMQWTGTL